MLVLSEERLIDSNKQNPWTALHAACYNGGNLEIVKLLLDHGANVNALDHVSGFIHLYNCRGRLTRRILLV